MKWIGIFGIIVGLLRAQEIQQEIQLREEQEIQPKNFRQHQKNLLNPNPQIPPTPPTPNHQPHHFFTPPPSPPQPPPKKSLPLPSPSPSFLLPTKSSNNDGNQRKLEFYCGKSYPKMELEAYDGVKREKMVRTVYGFNMYVDVRDRLISAIIESSGTWKHDYISLMGHIVKPGHKVLNLGSQSGLEALVMGKIVGPTGRLFIFEPYSFSNELVTKNVELNGLQDITTIYKVGASDQKGTAIINIAYMNTGGSEIIPAPENQQGVPTSGEFGKYSESEVVQLDRVDELLPQDVALDFALLDVEKMETKALKGMKKIIERSPNLVIMTEWQFARNPRANKQETLEVLKFLTDLGYKAYSYSPNFQNCLVGTFTPIEIQSQLLTIQKQSIFLFPKSTPLPT